MLPNTTQIPNKLFNGELTKMKDTELRIVLIVARKTLGWIENPATGMRKEEDWISEGQLIKLSGQSKRSVKTARQSCIEKEWIEARDSKGNLLDTPKKRENMGRGGKIFYRLGKVFLSKTEGCNNYPLSKKEKGCKNKEANFTPYKRNLLTKEDSLKKYKQGKRPFYNDLEMRWSKNMWWVIPADNSQWQEFAGLEKDIDWK